MLRAITYVGQGLLCVAAVLCLAVVIAPKFVDRLYYGGTRFRNPDGDDPLCRADGTSRSNFLFRYITGGD